MWCSLDALDLTHMQLSGQYCSSTSDITLTIGPSVYMLCSAWENLFLMRKPRGINTVSRTAVVLEYEVKNTLIVLFYFTKLWKSYVLIFVQHKRLYFLVWVCIRRFITTLICWGANFQVTLIHLHIKKIQPPNKSYCKQDFFSFWNYGLMNLPI